MANKNKCTGKGVNGISSNNKIDGIKNNKPTNPPWNKLNERGPYDSTLYRHNKKKNMLIGESKTEHLKGERFKIFNERVGTKGKRNSQRVGTADGQGNIFSKKN